MKKFFKSLKTTIISGIIFLLPVFVVLIIIQKLYSKLTGFGAQLAALLGIKSVAGIGATSIATTFILLGLFLPLRHGGESDIYFRYAELA
jgi:uncharacterized membrane protein